MALTGLKNGECHGGDKGGRLCTQEGLHEGRTLAFGRTPGGKKERVNWRRESDSSEESAQPGSVIGGFSGLVINQRP